VLDTENRMLYDLVLRALNTGAVRLTCPARLRRVTRVHPPTEPSPKRAKDDAQFGAFDGTRLLVQFVAQADGGIEVDTADEHRISPCCWLQTDMKVSLQGKALLSQGSVVGEVSHTCPLTVC
jgi:hypothetical protein